MPLHRERIYGLDEWEKRKPPQGATTIEESGMLLESDTGAKNQFVLLESDLGFGTDIVLLESSP